jgi:hypothetical protein
MKKPRQCGGASEAGCCSSVYAAGAPAANVSILVVTAITAVVGRAPCTIDFGGSYEPKTIKQRGYDDRHVGKRAAPDRARARGS